MDERTTEFDHFWAAYPRRVGKLAAVKAYRKARTVASAAEILSGVRNYCAHLPDDVRYIAHAATWLNQGRWMDEYAAPTRYVDDTWFEECQQLHDGSCNGRRGHETRMAIDAHKRAATS